MIRHSESAAYRREDNADIFALGQIKDALHLTS